MVGSPVAQLLRRPVVRIEALAPVLSELVPGFFRVETTEGSEITAGATVEERGLSRALPSQEHGASAPAAKFPAQVLNELRAVETEIKYAGYLDQQRKSIEKLKRAESLSIPAWFDYQNVSGLSREMQEKLSRVRPQTVGQASRIPGVTPAGQTM